MVEFPPPACLSAQSSPEALGGGKNERFTHITDCSGIPVRVQGVDPPTHTTTTR